jgi:hypothetical protein
LRQLAELQLEYNELIARQERDSRKADLESQQDALEDQIRQIEDAAEDEAQTLMDEAEKKRQLAEDELTELKTNLKIRKDEIDKDREERMKDLDFELEKYKSIQEQETVETINQLAVRFKEVQDYINNINTLPPGVVKVVTERSEEITSGAGITSRGGGSRSWGTDIAAINGWYVCPICGAKWQDPAKLSAHMSQFHSGSGMLPVESFAEGGFVNKPTLALLGDKEPEFAIPASKMGGLSINFTDLVILDREESVEKLAQAVYERIKRTQRLETGSV